MQPPSRPYAPVAVAFLLLWLSAFHAEATSWLAPAIPDVAVQDQDGRGYRFYSDLLRGRTVLIDFIFTTCKTACPTQTSVLREVRKQLRNHRLGAGSVLLISVTVDPQHDGPHQLREYADRFDIETGIPKGWVFLTGDSQELTKLLQAFGSGSRQPSDHSNVLWIGNEFHRRWTRTAAFNTPEHFTHLLDEVSR